MKKLVVTCSFFIPAVCLILIGTNALSQPPQIGFNAMMDELPTPFALQMFKEATEAECHVLESYNPNITYCGVDYLRRNPTLQSWGLSTPGPNLVTVTRYNPVRLSAIQNQYGSVAAFFVFAHEGGHHFDIHFPNSNVPWQVPHYPSVDYPYLPNVPGYVAYSWNRELRADAWGGCAVKETGNQIASVQALQNITAHIENADVPPFNYAKEAIQAGYDACN